MEALGKIAYLEIIAKCNLREDFHRELAALLMGLS